MVNRSFKPASDAVMQIDRRPETDIFRRSETAPAGAAFAKALRDQSTSACGDRRVGQVDRRESRPERSESQPGCAGEAQRPAAPAVTHVTRVPSPDRPVKRVIIGPHRPPERLPGPVSRMRDTAEPRSLSLQGGAYRSGGMEPGDSSVRLGPRL